MQRISISADPKADTKAKVVVPPSEEEFLRRKSFVTEQLNQSLIDFSKSPELLDTKFVVVTHELVEPTAFKDLQPQNTPTIQKVQEQLGATQPLAAGSEKPSISPDIHKKFQESVSNLLRHGPFDKPTTPEVGLRLLSDTLDSTIELPIKKHEISTQPDIKKQNRWEEEFLKNQAKYGKASDLQQSSEISYGTIQPMSPREKQSAIDRVIELGFSVELVARVNVPEEKLGSLSPADLSMLADFNQIRYNLNITPTKSENEVPSLTGAEKREPSLGEQLLKSYRVEMELPRSDNAYSVGKSLEEQKWLDRARAAEITGMNPGSLSRLRAQGRVIAEERIAHEITTVPVKRVYFDMESLNEHIETRQRSGPTHLIQTNKLNSE